MTRSVLREEGGRAERGRGRQHTTSTARESVTALRLALPPLSGRAGLLLQAPRPTSCRFHYSGGRLDSAWRSASPGPHCTSGNGNAPRNLRNLGAHRLPHLPFVTGHDDPHLPPTKQPRSPPASVDSILLQVSATSVGTITTASELASLLPATPLHTNTHAGSSSLKLTVSFPFAKAFTGHARLRRCVWLPRGAHRIFQGLCLPLLPSLTPSINMGLSHTNHLYPPLQTNPPSSPLSTATVYLLLRQNVLGVTPDSSLSFYPRIKSFHGRCGLCLQNTFPNYDLLSMSTSTTSTQPTSTQV